MYGTCLRRQSFYIDTEVTAVLGSSFLVLGSWFQRRTVNAERRTQTMKILFFCNIIPNKLGAYERWLVTFGQFLHEKGDELVVAFPGELHPDVARDLEAARATCVSMDGWTDADGREHAWAFVGLALRHLRRFKPDLVVVNFGNEWPSAVTALLASCSGHHGVKWIWQQHQQVCDPSSITARFSAIRALGWFFKHFISVYDGGRASLLKRGLSPSRVDVVYNGIQDHESKNVEGWLKEELGLSPDTLLLANTGWLIPRKRAAFVLKAYARVRERVAAPLALVIVGDGPLAESLKRLARELGVGDTVYFLGLRNDVREILGEVDVLVHAALAETCTYVISEAMCARVPSVVTDAGASREQIVSGETGYVVTQDDADAFVDNVIQVLSDASLRKAMGIAARQRWEQRYTIDRAAETYYDICRRVLAGPDV